MYTKHVSNIIQWHGLSYHSHADDTQLYMTRDHSINNCLDGLARIQSCVSEIREWMYQNMLKQNLTYQRFHQGNLLNMDQRVLLGHRRIHGTP